MTFLTAEASVTALVTGAGWFGFQMTIMEAAYLVGNCILSKSLYLFAYEFILQAR